MTMFESLNTPAADGRSPRERSDPREQLTGPVLVDGEHRRGSSRRDDAPRLEPVGARQRTRRARRPGTASG